MRDFCDTRLSVTLAYHKRYFNFIIYFLVSPKAGAVVLVVYLIVTGAKATRITLFSSLFYRVSLQQVSETCLHYQSGGLEGEKVVQSACKRLYRYW
jgi:hypothetical protein